MDTKRILKVTLLLVLLATMVLTACGGGGTSSTSTGGASNNGSSSDNTSTGDSTTDTSSGDQDTEPAAPTVTPAPQDLFPENLIIHPEAFDFEVTQATNTYVYYVPMMVAEALEYFETEMSAIGWEELGKPTLMGHLATLNLQQADYRLNISFQDNELSETTRVQMLLNEQ